MILESLIAIILAATPPITGGALRETTYDSGEVSTVAIDLDAGGRAGWNVAFDRSYRSRTMLSNFLGNGWESGLFVRLRPMLNGVVEYAAPIGLSLKLTATSSGWNPLDQKMRVTFPYDDSGAQRDFVRA